MGARPLVTECDGCLRRRLCGSVHTGNGRIGLVWLCRQCIATIDRRLLAALSQIVAERMAKAR